MKKLAILFLALMPLYAWAQDNTWERPEEEETTEEVKVKVNPDAKYLKGAVTEIDGKVVFNKCIDAPGKSASQVYNIVKKYMEKMVREKNQINSQVVVTDSVKYELGATYTEWLVFKSNAIVLDRTQFCYVLQAKCQNSKADITISRIHYIYGEGNQQLRYRAEEWITDKTAVNKKNTRLLPLSGKFRRKTIDRKDFLFNKFDSLLK
jgi:colicin import membrane protein